MAEVVEMNEVGLLSYNYDVEDPSGQIDDTKTNQIKKSVKDTNKEPILSPKQKQNVVNAPQSSSSSPPTKMTQCQTFCTGTFYWVPIRSLCFFGALALFILPFIDDKFGSPTVVEWFLGWYIQGFAILAMFIESPTWFITQKVQLWVFFYARFLRRASGRAGFYITVSFLTFSGLHDKITVTMFAGIYMVLVAALMLLFSGLAAKQLHLMHNYMVDGDDFQTNEYDQNQLSERILSHYTQIDVESTKKIGAQQLYKFAEKSLKRKLSNSERYTIQCYLDVSCNGHITPQDWTTQFMKSGTVKML